MTRQTGAEMSPFSLEAMGTVQTGVVLAPLLSEWPGNIRAVCQEWLLPGRCTCSTGGETEVVPTTPSCESPPEGFAGCSVVVTVCFGSNYLVSTGLLLET